MTLDPDQHAHSREGVLVAQLVGRRSWRRGQTAGGGSIPRWSASKPQVVTRRKAKGAGQKKSTYIPEKLLLRFGVCGPCGGVSFSIGMFGIEKNYWACSQMLQGEEDACPGIKVQHVLILESILRGEPSFEKLKTRWRLDFSMDGVCACRIF